MLAQRAMQSSLRRAFQNPVLRTNAVLANGIQKRYVATEKVSQEAGHQVLVEQRLHRPVAPHISIYQPQMTWYASGLNRITGVILSGGVYLFGLSYLAAPAFGWHIESSAMAAAFGGMSVGAKSALKFLVAMPFTFHCWNGFRHLAWDTGRGFGKQQVIRTGWFVVGLTMLSSGYLAFM